MLAKLTSKNQLTLPKSVTDALGPVQYFEVQNKAGQIILTPVRIQRGDALRAKLAELKIDAETIESAVAWAEPARATRPRRTQAVKKPPKKPLRDAPPTVRRSQVSATNAKLRASLKLVFAKAGGR